MPISRDFPFKSTDDASNIVLANRMVYIYKISEIHVASITRAVKQNLIDNRWNIVTKRFIQNTSSCSDRIMLERKVQRGPYNVSDTNLERCDCATVRNSTHTHTHTHTHTQNDNNRIPRYFETISRVTRLKKRLASKALTGRA